MNMTEKVQLNSLVRYWKHIAGRAGLEDSIRESYADCSQALSGVLDDVPGGRVSRQMQVTVYGRVSGEFELAGRLLAEAVFPGMAVAVVAVRVRPPATSGERSSAAAARKDPREDMTYVAEVTMEATEPGPASSPEFAGRQRSAAAPAAAEANGGSSV